MTTDNGGERETLAPVIPLFGAPDPVALHPSGGRVGSSTASTGDPGDTDEAGQWHATWTTDRSASASPDRPSTPPRRIAAVEDVDTASSAVEERRDAADRAERILLRKLRTRSLSLREARSVLTEAELDLADAEDIVERFVGLGYLDDLALAEQLIEKATSRKAQGRQAVAQTLSQRGIPREVIDEALAELPDDEEERALDFARSKARGMEDLERDVALRRLYGQLARRGYGAVAFSAARRALDELRSGPRRGVRFEP